MISSEELKICAWCKLTIKPEEMCEHGSLHKDCCKDVDAEMYDIDGWHDYIDR